jgi:hypothetical protein
LNGFFAVLGCDWVLAHLSGLLEFTAIVVFVRDENVRLAAATPSLKFLAWNRDPALNDDRCSVHSAGHGRVTGQRPGTRRRFTHGHHGLLQIRAAVVIKPES